MQQKLQLEKVQKGNAKATIFYVDMTAIQLINLRSALRPFYPPSPLFFINAPF